MLGLCLALIFIFLYVNWLPLVAALITVTIFASRGDANWYILLVQGLLGGAAGWLLRQLRPHEQTRRWNDALALASVSQSEQLVEYGAATGATLIYALLYRRTTHSVALYDPWTVPDVGRFICIMAVGALVIFVNLIRKSWLSKPVAITFEHLLILCLSTGVTFLDLLVWPSGGSGRAASAVSIGAIVALVAVCKFFIVVRDAKVQ